MSSAADADPAPDQDWYSVRCVFRRNNYTPAAYEERITVWHCADLDEASALAEAEAREYAEVVGSQYLDLAQAYHLADNIGHSAEVYSLIRDSDLPPAEYLAAFFDTGSEHQGTVDEPPGRTRS